MLEYKLKYPIYTHEKEILFPEGILLTDEVIRKHIAANKTEYPKLCVLEFDTVKQDILTLISKPPYKTIFSDKPQQKILLEIMGEVVLPVPVLNALNYFKANDYYTYRHILMVFALSALLAIILIDDPKNLTRDIIACPTHDIGKISIPLEILIKETPLKKSELEILQQHTIAGYALMSYYFKDLTNVSGIGARDHHERKDGTGYPAGKHLTDKIVDIIVVGDVYDALISPRPYRPLSFDNRTALEEITWMAQKGAISKEVVQALVANNRANRPDYKDCELSLERRGTPPLMNSYGKISDE